MGPRSSSTRRGTAYAVTFGLLVIANGPVLPLVAYFLRHVTLTPSTWRLWLTLSLVVGAAIPLLIVVAVGVVALIAHDSERSPLLMLGFALCWSAPGLIANHNALSDLRHGPEEIVEQVRATARSEDDDGDDHTWYECTVTFADGRERELDRYQVEYRHQDPCHGIRAGDRLRLVKLPHLDELIAIDDLGSDGK